MAASAAWSCDYVPDAAAGGAAQPDPRYAQALARFLADKPAPHYVVFTSDRDSDKNGGDSNDTSYSAYWCPDCVTSLPAVRRAAKRTGASLLEVGVGPRAAWRGNASHAFRGAPLGLTGVPTLVRLAAGGGGEEVEARLGPELEAAGTPEEAESLAAAFFVADGGKKGE
jgi:hypothetical protein